MSFEYWHADGGGHNATIVRPYIMLNLTFTHAVSPNMGHRFPFLISHRPYISIGKNLIYEPNNY